MSNLVVIRDAAVASYDWLNSSATALHPYISQPLLLGAALFTGCMSVGCAVLGDEDERLAFIVLAIACFMCGTENLAVAHANASVDPQTALAQLQPMRLHLSAMSNVLLISFPLVLSLRIEANLNNATRLVKVWHFVVPALISSGVIAAVLCPQAIGEDEIICTLAAVMAGAGLIAWARRYGLIIAAVMAAAAASFAIPQNNYWEGVISLDVMRLGVLVIGLVLSIPLLAGSKAAST